MTATEKAIELVDRYSELGIGNPTSLLLAKQCALIAVDEILDNGFHFIDDSKFWKQVKEELLKI